MQSDGRMTKPYDTWTVQPHGALYPIDTNIWSVVGALHMPLGEFPRRMTVVRLASGELVIFSAIALGEAEMSKLEAIGRPAFLIVPSDRHRLDVKPWKARYPNIVVATPRGAREKVEELVPVDTTAPDFGDPNVTFITMPGTADREAALRVGSTLVLNELIFNVPSRDGFTGWLFDLLGMTGDHPHMPGVIKHKDVDDKAALAHQFRDWSREDITRIVVSHGNVIEANAREVLEKIGAELDD